MKPEDALNDLLRKTCTALAAKFRRCANDEKFLEDGSKHFKTPRDAMRAAFLQAAHDAEVFRDKSTIFVVSRDKPLPK